MAEEAEEDEGGRVVGAPEGAEDVAEVDAEEASGTPLLNAFAFSRRRVRWRSRNSAASLAFCMRSWFIFFFS